MADQAREEFIARRLTGIGGSDVAPIMGMSKYRTALHVYLEKRGLVESRDSVVLEEGRYMEEPILQWYIDTQGCKVLSRSQFYCHHEHQWLIGNLDMEAGNAEGDEWIVDAKTSMRLADPDDEMFTWGEVGTDEVPLDALFQAQHYLLLRPNAHRVDFPTRLMRRWPPKLYHVQRNPEWFDLVFPTLRRFWFEHVLAGVPPEPDFADARVLGAIRTLYPPKAEKEEPRALLPVVEINGAVVSTEQLIEAFNLLGKVEKEIGNRRDRIEAALRATLGDSKAGKAGALTVTRVYNKGGDRPPTHINPYDYLMVRLPKDYTRTLTPARAQALIEGNSSSNE